jgi:hypothetical protein
MSESGKEILAFTLLVTIICFAIFSAKSCQREELASKSKCFLETKAQECWK